ncbi:putative NADH dehydrogenase [Escovopsis weberi]|uniref:Putative NADH dehydrogenase n=1 Tax=Escovopsis weberi TaxID=150374 RepID=A0A0M8MQZ0_ESCWE|nr:putative NADH dehydrogenase [Escovopsis weberi]
MGSVSTRAAQHGPDKDKERVVILGSGWAGYGLARTLSASKYTRILISPRSHFVFTPLLASTSVGTLEFRAAIEPVRRLGLSEFHQAWASSIDFGRKVIRVEANTQGDVGARTDAQQLNGSRAAAAAGWEVEKGPEFEVEYDKLVIAVGCYSQTFGIEGVKEHACFLRDIGDARTIRLRVLEAFERAALPPTDEAERRALLHFVVVGGGPTGIEFAAELHDLVHEDLAKLYPSLVPLVRITIYDIAPKVLPMFDRNLASYATDLFRRQGIEVKTEHHLECIRREEGDGRTLKLRVREEAEEVDAGLVVWSTGLMQNPLVGRILGEDVGIEGLGRICKDPRTGGIVTDEYMRVQVQVQAQSEEQSSQSQQSQQGPDGEETSRATLPDVFAIGDCAVVEGQQYPATAQVANQQAVYLGRRFNEETRSSTARAPQPFRFRNLGVMAYLGSQKAIHQSSADELKGWPAWVLWRTAYLTKSMSIRNKIMIPVHWLVTWVFGRDISRF